MFVDLNALYKLKKNVSKPPKPPSPQTRPKAPPLQATVQSSMLFWVRLSGLEAAAA
jgi:hypothetical protein